MTRAYALEPAPRMAIVGYLGVVLTQVMGTLWLDEPIGTHQVAGALLVIGAGLVFPIAELLERPVVPRPAER